MHNSNIYFNSPVMKGIIRRIEALAKVDWCVTFVGPPGAGKSFLAEYLALKSPRSKNLYLKISCGNFSEVNLLDELFGHVKGAFTDAYSDKKGVFEECDKGILFLDEIHFLKKDKQGVILQYLDDKIIYKFGDKRHPIKVDVRLIFATNEDLNNREIFRKDFVDRISTSVIKVPPLKDHIEDLPILVKYFFDKFKEEVNAPGMNILDDCFKVLMEHEWSGNIRELQSVLKNAIILALEEGSNNITPSLIKEILKEKAQLETTNFNYRFKAEEKPFLSFSPNKSLEDYKKEIIKYYYERYGNKSEVARKLKIHRRTVSRLLDGEKYSNW